MNINELEKKYNELAKELEGLKNNIDEMKKEILFNEYRVYVAYKDKKPYILHSMKDNKYRWFSCENSVAYYGGTLDSGQEAIKHMQDNKAVVTEFISGIEALKYCVDKFSQ